MRSVVDKVALGQVVFKVISFTHSLWSTSAPYSFIYHEHHIIVVVDSIFKSNV
jgi:hypothetical protein